MHPPEDSPSAAGGVRFRPAGERAVLVEFGEGASLDPAVTSRVLAMHEALGHRPARGVIEWVPGYRSLLVEYEPMRAGYGELVAALRELHAHTGPVAVSTSTSDPQTAGGSAGRLVELPVAYGGEFGPDLPFVAQTNGLSEAEVIRIHSEVEYRVLFMGFSPGFPFLGGLSPRIAAPRLEHPRTRVPAGSVGIAGRQTGIYPTETPGGWRIIGRTPLRLFDPGRPEPFLLQPGDRVRFRPIDARQYRPAHRWGGGKGENEEAEDETGACGGGDSSTGSSTGILILRPGVLATVQDLGRRGFQRWGLSVSGAADDWSFRWANLLAGNDAGAAAIEFAYGGAMVRFERPARIALTGAAARARVDGKEVPLWASLPVRSGQVLEIDPPAEGVYVYLAVAGGLRVSGFLGSACTDLLGKVGGVEGRPLRAGDRLPVGDDPGAHKLRGSGAWRLNPRWVPRFGGEVSLRVVMGPQEDWFSEESVEAFLGAPYRVTPRSDRQGCRLEGPLIRHRDRAELPSEGVPAGAVQVPAGQQPIILLANRQSVGGYPKIACVISADLHRAAQLRPGQQVRFQAVSLEEAHRAYRRYMLAFAFAGARG